MKISPATELRSRSKMIFHSATFCKLMMLNPVCVSKLTVATSMLLETFPLMLNPTVYFKRSLYAVHVILLLFSFFHCEQAG